MTIKAFFKAKRVCIFFKICKRIEFNFKKMKGRCHLDDLRSSFYLKISHVTLTIQEAVYDRITQNLPKHIIKVVVEVFELFVMFY